MVFESKIVKLHLLPDFIFYCCRKRNAKMQKELEEACKDTRGISPEEFSGDVGPSPKHSAVPTKATVKFVSSLSHISVF